MKKRQMRMGMFDHAKYSRPVIRGMPDEILQEVRKELRTLLNGPEEATTSRKRSHEDANANNQDEEGPAESGNIMLPTHQRINILVPTPTGGNQPSVNVASGSVASMMVARAQRQEKDKKKTAKTVNPTLSQVRAALLAPDPRANKSQQANKQPAMKKGDLLPPRLMEYCRQNGRMMGLEAEGEDFTPSTGDGDSSGQQHQEVLCTPPQNPRELMLCTPPQRNRDDDEQQQQRKQFHRRDEAKADNQEQKQSGEIFPKKPPLKEIAAKLMESCPTITLRPDEPMTLADATFSLVRRALDAAKERSQAKKDNHGAAGCSSSFTAMEENPEIMHSPYRAIANNTFFFDDQMEEAMAAKRGRGFFDDNNSFMAPNQPYLDESPLADLEDEMIFADSMLGSTTRADSRIDGTNNNNKQKQSRHRHFDAGASIPSKSVRTSFARNNKNYEDNCANSTLPRGDDAVFDERLMMGPSARPMAGNRFGNNSGNNNALQQLGFRPPQMRTRRFGFDFDGGGSQLGGDGGRGHQQQQQQGSSRQLLQQGVGGGNSSNQAAGGFVGGRSFVDQLQQQQQDITATSAASNDTAADDNDDGDGSDDGMMDQDDGNGNLTYF